MSDDPRKPARQPRVGSVQVDSLGRRWRKVRRLPKAEYDRALVDAAFDARFKGVTDETLRSLGYELDEATP